MRIVRFTRDSNGLPMYAQAEHIVMIRNLESNPSVTLVITTSEVDTVSEDLDTAIALWTASPRTAVAAGKKP